MIVYLEFVHYWVCHACQTLFSIHDLNFKKIGQIIVFKIDEYENYSKEIGLIKGSLPIQKNFGIFDENQNFKSIIDILTKKKVNKNDKNDKNDENKNDKNNDKQPMDVDNDDNNNDKQNDENKNDDNNNNESKTDDASTNKKK